MPLISVEVDLYLACLPLPLDVAAALGDGAEV